MTDVTSLAGLRVAVDARYLNRPGMGIHRYLTGLLPVIEASGADITLLVDDEGENLSCRGLHVAALKGRNLYWEQISLSRHLRHASYDVYLAPANRGVPVARAGTPVVLVVHDLIPLVLWRLYLLQSLSMTISYLVGHTIAVTAADEILAVSHATSRDVRRYFRRASRVAYPTLPAQRTVLADPPRTPVVIYNGGADRRKQVPVLLRAFADLLIEHPDARLRLIGAGYDEYRPLARHLGIDERVEFTGLLSEGDKDAAVASGSVVVLPSMYEGFGLPVVEAFAAGTPVVCGEGGALGEISGEAAVRVDVTDPRSVAEGMREALVPRTRVRVVEAGRRRLAVLAAQPGPEAVVAALSRSACSRAGRRRVPDRW